VLPYGLPLFNVARDNGRNNFGPGVNFADSFNAGGISRSNSTAASAQRQRSSWSVAPMHIPRR
jgi:hypothetical protein